MKRAIAASWSRHALRTAIIALAVWFTSSASPVAHAQISNQLSIAGFTRAPATASAGTTDVPILTLTLTTSAGVSGLSDLTLTRLGEGADSDITMTGVRLWLDANGNGIVDGADRLAASGSLVGGHAILKTDLRIDWFAPVQVIIAADIAGTAAVNATFGLAIDDRSDVRTNTDSVIAGSFPVASELLTIQAPPAPAEVESQVAVTGNEAASVTSQDGQITATVPPGASPVDLTVSLASTDPAAFPPRPGTPLSDVMILEWDSAPNPEPEVLSSPIHVEIEIDRLFPSGVDPQDMQVLALDEAGNWRALPATLSADGLNIVFSISVETTFTIVGLTDAASDFVPAGGSSVESSNGVTATVSSGASDGPVFISVTPSATPAPNLGTGADVVAPPIFFHQEDPATGEPVDLDEPVILSIPLPAPKTLEYPSCGIVAYGIPADGGPPQPLPSQVGPNGLEILVDVSVDITVMLVSGPAVGSLSAAPGEEVSLQTNDGTLQIIAPPTDDGIVITVGPVTIPTDSAEQVGGTIVTPPRHVAMASPSSDQPSETTVLVEFITDALPQGIDAPHLQAFAIESASVDPTASDQPASTPPAALPTVYDADAGVVRVAISESVTIFLAADTALQDLNLGAGWNLVTYSGPDDLPLSFLDTALGDRLAAADRWNAEQRAWEPHFPNLPQASSLETLQSGDAIWVLITEGPSIPWIFPDPPPPPRGVLLYPGWNLVSWSGPTIPAGELVAPLQGLLRSGFHWDPAIDGLSLFLPAVGPPLPVDVQTQSALWLLIESDEPVLWEQPGISAA